MLNEQPNPNESQTAYEDLSNFSLGSPQFIASFHTTVPQSASVAMCIHIPSTYLTNPDYSLLMQLLMHHRNPRSSPPPNRQLITLHIKHPSTYGGQPDIIIFDCPRVVQSLAYDTSQHRIPDHQIKRHYFEFPNTFEVHLPSYTLYLSYRISTRRKGRNLLLLINKV